MVQVARVVRQASPWTNLVTLGKVVEATWYVAGMKGLQIQVCGKKVLDTSTWAVSSNLVVDCSMRVVVVVVGTAYERHVDVAPSRPNRDRMKAARLDPFARSDSTRPCLSRSGHTSVGQTDERAGGGEISKWKGPPLG